jgi:hypothetical protein
MTKKSIFIIYSLLLFITIFTFETIAKRLDPKWGNNPIERLSDMYVAVLFYLGYVLYLWKFKLSEFLKRLSISIPFAMMFSVFVKLLGYDIYWSTLAGMFCSVMLLLKTTNWKKHFVVILIASCAFSIFGTLFFSYSGELQVISFAYQGFILLGLVLIFSFLLLYLEKTVKEERLPDLKAIFIRSLKFSIALCLFFFVYLVLNFYDRLSLPYSVQLMVNTLLSILFLVVCYRFNLLLIERKELSEKKFLSGFWNALHNLQGKTKSNGVCECCGKPTPQELLFKADSDQWVCAACLAKGV